MENPFSWKLMHGDFKCVMCSKIAQRNMTLKDNLGEHYCLFFEPALIQNVYGEIPKLLIGEFCPEHWEEVIGLEVGAYKKFIEDGDFNEYCEKFI